MCLSSSFKAGSLHDCTLYSTMLLLSVRVLCVRVCVCDCVIVLVEVGVDDDVLHSGCVSRSTRFTA